MIKNDQHLRERQNQFEKVLKILAQYAWNEMNCESDT